MIEVLISGFVGGVILSVLMGVVMCVADRGNDE